MHLNLSRTGMQTFKDLYRGMDLCQQPCTGTIQMLARHLVWL